MDLTSIDNGELGALLAVLREEAELRGYSGGPEPAERVEREALNALERLYEANHEGNLDKALRAPDEEPDETRGEPMMLERGATVEEAARTLIRTGIRIGKEALEEARADRAPKGRSS